jgi:Protein of unknwon function (DUF3310)
MTKAIDSQVGGDHYKNLVIQPIQYAHANNLDFFQGAIVKYATRWKNKNGLQDLEKIIHITQMYIELEKAKSAPSSEKPLELVPNTRNVCDTCVHSKNSVSQYPCSTCYGHKNWEPVNA